MKKKVLSLCLVIIIVCLCFIFTSCNKNLDKTELNLPVGSYPSTLSNRITGEDLNLIETALNSNSTEDQKKTAIMALYNIANSSRMETGLSLMVQNTNMIPTMELGQVYMRGFTLKSGDSWFYQFAAQGVSTDDAAAILLNAFGSQQLQIGYTKGDGKYYYFKEMSSKPECNCSLEQFPYATFKVTNTLDEYTSEDDFQAKRYYLNSQLEINNMNLVKDIIADGSTISYDSSKHLYTVNFSVDCINSDSVLLEKWYECANKDMMDSGNKILGYNEWYATMEVWDNGYVKSFVSNEDRRAGSGKGAFGEIAGGKTRNAFEYIYDENEIRLILAEDARFNAGSTMTIDEFMNGYILIANNKQPASLSALAKIIIIIVSVLVGIIVIIVTLIEILLKKGKLPKIAAKRAKRKEKRLAKKEAKKNK